MLRPEPCAMPLPPPTPAGRSLRILLAEDNKINQQLVTMLLRKAGHQVDVADNGEVAVEAVNKGEYDVVLMDVQMPILDGVQATARIRALPRRPGPLRLPARVLRRTPIRAGAESVFPAS